MNDVEQHNNRVNPEWPSERHRPPGTEQWHDTSLDRIHDARRTPLSQVRNVVLLVAALMLASIGWSRGFGESARDARRDWRDSIEKVRDVPTSIGCKLEADSIRAAESALKRREGRVGDALVLVDGGYLDGLPDDHVVVLDRQPGNDQPTDYRVVPVGKCLK